MEFFVEWWQTAVTAQQLPLAELCPCPIPAQQMSPLPDSNNCHPVQQSKWKSWLNSSGRRDQSGAFPPPSHRYLIYRGQCPHTPLGTWSGTVLMGASCWRSFTNSTRSPGWLLPSSPFPRPGQKGWQLAHGAIQTCTPTAHTVPVLFGCHQHKT